MIRFTIWFSTFIITALFVPDITGMYWTPAVHRQLDTDVLADYSYSAPRTYGGQRDGTEDYDYVYASEPDYVTSGVIDQSAVYLDRSQDFDGRSQLDWNSYYNEFPSQPGMFSQEQAFNVDVGGFAKAGYAVANQGKKQKKKKKKKKQKFIFTTANSIVYGGNRLKGVFKSLKACQKACSRQGCFGGDYNKKLGTCYAHTTTNCDSMTPSHGATHFSAVPCTSDLDVANELYTGVYLGNNAPYGYLDKSAKGITDCMKKCRNAAGGLASTAQDAVVMREFQLCFGIDYDVVTHKCYLHFRHWFIRSDTDREVSICNNNNNVVRGVYPDNLGNRATNVHIVFCPYTPPDP